jgi:hypothetical protein
MKTAALFATLALAALTPLAHAITLNPGQSATPDTLPFYAPNEVDVTGGGDATLIAYPGIPVAGYYSFGVAHNSLNGNTSYNFHITLSAPLPLTSISFKGYAGVSVDAGFINGDTFVPSSVSRSADGDVITFSFDSLPTFADPSRAIADANFILRTDAPDFAEYFQSANLSFVDSSLPGGNFGLTLNAIAPAPIVTNAPVPELSSLSLLMLAGSALAVRYRRRLA